MEWLGWILEAQNTLQRALSTTIRQAASGEGGLLSAVGLAAVLGAVHALTPGHGKAVVFSYFVGRAARPWAGTVMAAKIALTHVTAAVILVAIFGSAVSTFGRPAGAAVTLQTLSYAAIALFGAVLLVQSIRNRGRQDHAAHHGGGLLPFAVGLLPCPLTMLVVTFAWIQSTVWTGLLFAALIGVGAAVTITVFGTLGMLVRTGAILGFDPEGRRYALLLDALEIASAAAIFLGGALFFLGGLLGPQ